MKIINVEMPARMALEIAAALGHISHIELMNDARELLKMALVEQCSQSELDEVITEARETKDVEFPMFIS